MGVTTEVRTITPDEAMAILEKNTANRAVRKTRVDAYSRDMKKRQWHLNGDPIRFNGKGVLLDGQHRLLACIMAQTPFETIVVQGLEEKVHSSIDTGANRTLADELRWMGEKDASTLAALLTTVWLYDNNQITRLTNVTRADAISLLKKQPEIREAVATTRIRKKFPIQGSPFGACMHLLHREHGEEVAEEFYLHLEAGTGYEEGDPCLALRNYATGIASKRLYRPNRVEWVAVIIKSMNSYLLGRPVKNLRWRRVGAASESFPRLLTREDLEA